MEDRLLSFIGGKIVRALLRPKLVVFTVALVFAFWPAARAVAFDSWLWVWEKGMTPRMERLQERNERMARQLLPPEPVPVAPGKLRQLRQDMRHS